MISYFDTSALIKKYVKEKGTDEVIKRWNGSKMLVISSVAYAEFFSAMNRKMRGRDIQTVRSGLLHFSPSNRATLHNG